MIEKITTKYPDFDDLKYTVNQLVDAVNYHQKWLSEIQCHIDTQPAENSTISKMENVDPYAEQRKWIGKICEFWYNDDTQQLSYGVLTKIDTETGFGVQYCCNDEYYYDSCQPVKPDDDIIYKGGDNE